MNPRHYFLPGCIAVTLLVIALIVGAFALTGCTGCASSTSAREPAPIPVPRPYNADRPVTWVTLSQQDGLATGDIIAVRPNYIYDVPAQFQIKYQALAAAHPVLPLPDWKSARQTDGTYQISAKYLNYYRALSEYQASTAVKP
jgi:hypothetical protein